MFDLPLGDYTITFDDGLYSQFYYLDEFLKFDTELIYFVSTDILCDTVQSSNFEDCRNAHIKASVGNKEDYMTIEQVQRLTTIPNVSVGGHSHSHIDLTRFDRTTDKIAHIKTDTELMINWFKQNLGFEPRKFCFPYNNDLNGLYTNILKLYGITEVYGRERTPIEMLQRIPDPIACHG